MSQDLEETEFSQNESIAVSIDFTILYYGARPQKRSVFYGVSSPARFIQVEDRPKHLKFILVPHSGGLSYDRLCLNKQFNWMVL